MLLIIVKWFHLDFNSVKVLCIVQHIQKINIRYLEYLWVMLLCTELT